MNTTTHFFSTHKTVLGMTWVEITEKFLKRAPEGWWDSTISESDALKLCDEMKVKVWGDGEPAYSSSGKLDPRLDGGGGYAGPDGWTGGLRNWTRGRVAFSYVMTRMISVREALDRDRPVECMIPKNLTRSEFTSALIQYNTEEGNSFDGFVLEMSWRDYQTKPEMFNHLDNFLTEKRASEASREILT